MDSKTLQVNIIRARRNNPCATLNEIGAKYGVTRERVRQVLSRAGKVTSAYHQTYLCIQCGKDMGTEEKLFCNKQCRYDYGHIKIACSYCGKFQEYSIKWLIWQIEHGRRSPDLFFCSQYCHGKWLGENHGFAIHPENMECSHERKWDYSKVYELRDETSWGANRISQTLGIPIPTINTILRKRGLILQ